MVRSTAIVPIKKTQSFALQGVMFEVKCVSEIGPRINLHPCSLYLIQLKAHWVRNGKHINFSKGGDEGAGEARGTTENCGKGGE